MNKNKNKKIKGMIKRNEKLFFLLNKKYNKK